MKHDLEALTDKEKEALRLLLVGHDAKSMARALDLSVHTVNDRLRPARREAEARGLEDITDEQVADWAEGMAETLSRFEVGDIVVHLDGLYWRIDETDIAFDGLFAAHDFERLPHAVALGDPGRLRRVLGDANYRFDRELPDRDPDR